MPQLQIKEFDHVKGVIPIEYLSSFDLNTKADAVKSDSNPPETGKSSDEIHEAGKMITDRIIKDLGHGRWENIPKHDIPIPQIRLPKQTIMPGEDEYAMVWPEEFTESTNIDTQTFLHPQGEIRHKDTLTGLVNADISGSLLLDEFPEERPSQQIPDIIWKGTPRTWITKPEEPPTYQGDEEGLVKLRFWVNKNGEVVNAIPVQKLSVELEEKALTYIFSWRFEPSMNISLQEGIIRINFKLDQ
jgi:TonB family protein